MSNNLVPIYVESLLNAKDYSDMSRKYGTYNFGSRPRPLSDFSTDGFKWRYGMGQSLSESEIKVFNSELRRVMQAAQIEWSTTF